MAPVKNARLLFNEIPTGYPVPGKTTVYDDSQTIDLDAVALDGGYLIKVLVLSIDPYMRGRMSSPDKKGYVVPFTIGKPIQGWGLGVVLRSEDPNVKAGDHLYGIYPYEQYTVQKHALVPFRKVEAKPNVPWSVYVGVAGMPGETAYYAWKEYANPQKGDVVFVTAAAGPVGATVVQLAKADGLKVIASAGSDEKVAFVQSLGADIAFNYKTTNTREVLEKEGPINIYWDNVGGETLEAVLDNAARGARLLECGMISGYNQDPYPIKNLMNVVKFELHLHGFIMTSLRAKYIEEFHTDFVDRISRGEIKYKEYLVRGIENGGQLLLDVLTGKNFGKAAVIVADD